MSDSLPDSTRAMVSVPPPGGNGTTRRTKRLGHPCAEEVCAEAVRGGKAATTADAAAATNRRRAIAAAAGPLLFELDLGLAGDRAPFVDFGCEEGGELIGRRADDLGAELQQSVFHHRMGERRDHVRVDLFDEGWRRLPRHEEGQTRSRRRSRARPLRRWSAAPA